MLSNQPAAVYRFTLRFANIVLFAISIGSLAWCVYAVANQKSHLYVRLAPAIVGLAAPFLLKFKPAARLAAASVLVGAVVGLYSAQLFALILTDPDRPILQAMEKEAKQAGVPFDGRTRIEVIDDLRSQGRTAYPPFYPYLLLDSPLQIDGGPAIALSGISNTMAVACNEGGQYLTYTTDEHGFPNPPGSWSASGIDIAIIGASSAVGECVPPADNLASQLRARYPHTVAVAAGGDGPLLELASIREYLQALKPKRVLWIFSESHTPEYLDFETHYPYLFHYLDPSFRQGLFEKQEALDKAIAQYFEDGIREEERLESWRKKARDFITLKNFRTVMYYFVAAKTARPKQFHFNSALYEQVLREGQRTAAAWGGTITVVYWPDPSRYRGASNYTPGVRELCDRTRGVFMDVAERVGVSVIDLSRTYPDSESMKDAEYFYSFPAHFKPAGYHLAGDAILSSIERNTK
jgi:hypothetical protein